jgi:hypothetical protein
LLTASLQKLIKREFYVEHHSYLKLLQSEHMQQLEQSLRDDLPAHQADHAAAVAAWERRGSPSRDEAPANGAAPEAALAGGDVSMTNGDEANDAAAAEGESAAVSGPLAARSQLAQVARRRRSGASATTSGTRSASASSSRTPWRRCRPRRCEPLARVRRMTGD